MRKISLLMFCIIACVGEHTQQGIEIASLLGRIRGSSMTSREGRQIFAFRGVRYAEPPVGPLRFKPPEPVKQWKNTFDASQEGPSCPQPAGKLQSEDCLRLNIYITELPIKISTPKPVIVHIHEGSYYKRSGQTYFAGPEYILDHEVVLVTINYRLGSLGFLSTGDSIFPGNLALKDQVQALRWVRDNIASFGGDPEAVTVMGASAGGRSISLHMVSPMSRGLFHRAIIMAGSAITQKPLPHHQKHYAKKLAESVNCSTHTSDELFKCLATKTPGELTGSMEPFLEWHKEPYHIWSPVVEPSTPGVERFLSAQPVDLIRKGKLYQLPVIIEITQEEFAGVIVERVERARNGDTSMFDDENANWTRLAPINFEYERETKRSATISEELRKYYLHDRPVGLDNYRGNAELYADALVRFPVHRLVNLVAENSRQPVYYSQFSYQGRYGNYRWSDGEPYGVCHMDDLMYLLHMEQFPLFDDTYPQYVVSKRLTAMWTAFARTGDPIPSGDDEFLNVTWIPFTKDNQAYLDIGNELVLKARLNEVNMKLWEKLFPL